VKSKGDFADILASGNPDIWHSHRPAQGGEAGAMFERIIERALEMRDARGGVKEAKKTAARKTTAAAAKTTKPRATKTARAAKSTRARKGTRGSR